MQLSEELLAANPGSMDSRPLVVVALSVLPLSIVTVFLPRDEPVRWSWFWIAIAIATVIAASMGITDYLHRKRNVRARSWVGLCQLSLMIAASGAGMHAGGTRIGIYNALLIVVLTIFAIFGDPPIVAVGAFLTFVTLGLATWANGVPLGQTVTVVVAHGICWGITAAIVNMLVSSLRAELDNAKTIELKARTLASVAQAGVRFTDLESALDTCMPSLREVISADHIVALAVGNEPTLRLVAADPPVVQASEDSGIYADADELAHTLSSGLPHLVGSRVYLPAGKLEDESIVLVLEGHPRAGDDPADSKTVAAASALVANMVERASFIAVLENLTRTDPLTGLANRTALKERIGHDLAQAARTQRPFCVVMIDLDHFKIYNDTNGHPAGDNILKAVASVLHSRARASDLVARYGGEEFCLCLPDTDLDGASAHVENQQRLVAGIGAEPKLTFSAGIALWDGTEDAAGIVGRADRAMYLAKSAGRNRIELDEISLDANEIAFVNLIDTPRSEEGDASRSDP